MKKQYVNKKNNPNSVRHSGLPHSLWCWSWFLQGSRVVAFLLREECLVGVSNRQFTNGYKAYEQGCDCALGKSFCRSCVANAEIALRNFIKKPPTP